MFGMLSMGGFRPTRGPMDVEAADYRATIGLPGCIDLLASDLGSLYAKSRSQAI